ncbi:MAG: hypothetical protein ACI8WB_004805 [Phenylobacterium sp.]|jgi:hypothetical protein
MVLLKGKNQMKMSVLVMLLLCGLARLSWAQGSTDRGLHLSADIKANFGQAIASGLLMGKVEVLLVGQDGQRVIPPKYQLKSGDKIRFRIHSSQDGYFSLSMMDKQGDKVSGALLNGPIKANRPLLLPTPAQGLLELDQQPGTEWLQLVISTQPKSLLKMAIKPVAPKHPNGEIKQIILRNITLSSAADQLVQYDAVEQAIYFSANSAMEKSVSLNVGLNHL